MSDRQMSDSSYTHLIDVGIENVDIAEWLFSLPDAEYQRCSPDHIAAGATWADDGRRMSINVETIGGSLVIQHYIAEVARPDYCKMVSISDVLTAHGRTKVQVIWELSAKAIDAGRCEYTNHVRAFATDEFLAFCEKNNINFADAAKARQEASSAHNKGETPLFAESIARRAREKHDVAA